MDVYGELELFFPLHPPENQGQEKDERNLTLSPNRRFCGSLYINQDVIRPEKGHSRAGTSAWHILYLLEVYQHPIVFCPSRLLA